MGSFLLSVVLDMGRVFLLSVVHDVGRVFY